MKPIHILSQADTVLLNGYVYSIDIKGQENTAQAIALKEGKIIYCGTNESTDAFIGPDTKVIDLEGKMVLPAFADIHNHSQEMTTAIFALDLYRYSSKDEYLEAIERWLKAHPDATYINGNGWNLGAFGSMLPTKELLDSVCPDIPVALFDTTHHVLWANSKALENANITKETLDPPGGVLERDKATGEPTGVFYEIAAYNMVMKAFPDFEVAQYKMGIQAYQKMANALGITLSQDCYLMPGNNAIQAYKELAQEGQLTMRIRGTYSAHPSVEGNHYKPVKEATKDFDQFIDTITERRKEDDIGDLFQMNAIKIFEDGGGHTSYLKKPFADLDSCGQTVWPDDQLKIICDKSEEAGFQIHVHAMGDAAIATTLDAFQFAKEQKRKSKRNIITHLMLVDDEDIDRMAELEVIGAPQPFWMNRDEWYSRMYFPFIGEDRTNQLYPMKSLIDKGIVMASSSDWPITPANNPLLAIQCGVTRTIPYDHPEIPMLNLDKNPEYRYPLGPTEHPTKECVNLKTMIQSTTINGAYATYLEYVTGSIEVDKSADLVILDKNLFDVLAKDIAKANVLMTLFRGDIVYQEKGLTISDAAIVKRKEEPSPLNDFAAPYKLYVIYGTSTSDLYRAINPPMGGSFELMDSNGTPISINQEKTVSDTMSVVSTSQDGEVRRYAISVLPEIISNNFEIDSVFSDGCIVQLDKAVSGLSKNDVYLLKDSNKVCASIIDITTPDGGKTYRIKAKEWTGDGKERDFKPQDIYQVYLYADGYSFERSQGQTIIIP